MKNINNGKRYEVVDKQTGEAFGNHTHDEAIARASAMRRNWQYKKNFVVREKISEARKIRAEAV